MNEKAKDEKGNESRRQLPSAFVVIGRIAPD